MSRLGFFHPGIIRSLHFSLDESVPSEIRCSDLNIE